mgnify:CR=1 FL=1
MSFRWAGVLLMPTVGEVQTVPGRLEDPDAGFRSRFDKADEHADRGGAGITIVTFAI